MKFAKLIEEALNAGQILIRRISPNQNSSKNQVTVLFHQRIAVPVEGNVNALVALAQNIEGAGKNDVVANFSFSADKVAACMPDLDLTTVNDFFDKEEVVTASELFGEIQVAIEVEENFDANEYDADGEVVRKLENCKVNPTTGETLSKDSKEIYRHTRLVAGTANHTFIQHDRVGAAQPVVKTENKIDAGAVS